MVSVKQGGCYTGTPAHISREEQKGANRETTTEDMIKKTIQTQQRLRGTERELNSHPLGEWN